MSIAAMNWAWRQDVKPVPKLILMALADAADDEGICWPSVGTIAGKSSVSRRIVQRVMQMLAERKLLVAEPRYRGDGSCSSNRYRLLLQEGDNLSPAPDRSDITPGASVRVPLTRVSYQEPPLEPKKNHHYHRNQNLNSQLVVVENFLIWFFRRIYCQPNDLRHRRWSEY